MFKPCLECVIISVACRDKTLALTQSLIFNFLYNDHTVIEVVCWNWNRVVIILNKEEDRALSIHSSISVLQKSSCRDQPVNFY